VAVGTRPGGESDRDDLRVIVDPAPPRPRRAAPPPAAPAWSLSGRLRDLLTLLGPLVAPAGVVTGVLYYFGWAYNTAYYRYFGIDHTLLGLGVQDYVLRSVRPVVIPLVVALLVGLLFVWEHTMFARLASQYRHRRTLRHVHLAIGMLGVTCLLTAVAVASSPADPDAALTMFGIPGGLALGAALLAYSIHWLRQIRRLRRRSRRPATPALAGSVCMVLLGALCMVGLLWVVANYAAAAGRASAYLLARSYFNGKPAVIVYSRNQLYLNEGGSVAERRLGDDERTYRYRYDGLRLLTRSDGKLFLVPANWSTANPVAIPLVEDPSIRIELVRTPPVPTRSGR
jgi:hypothetical protein